MRNMHGCSVTLPVHTTEILKSPVFEGVKTNLLQSLALEKVKCAKTTHQRIINVLETVKNPD